jgi:hypothetical protein
MDRFTLAYLGFLTSYAGDWERGGAPSAKARSLNPYHPGWYWLSKTSSSVSARLALRQTRDFSLYLVTLRPETGMLREIGPNPTVLV